MEKLATITEVKKVRTGRSRRASWDTILVLSFKDTYRSIMGQIFRKLMNALYTKKLEVVLVGLENR